VPPMQWHPDRRLHSYDYVSMMLSFFLVRESALPLMIAERKIYVALLIVLPGVRLKAARVDKRFGD